jgi:hypothetical protein
MICFTCQHYTHPDRELARLQGSDRCRCACHPWVTSADDLTRVLDARLLSERTRDGHR